MKNKNYFITSTGVVHYYDDEQISMGYPVETMRKMTDKEVFSHLNPPVDLTIEARIQRDSELARADIQLLKVQDGVTGIGTQKAWREYRCALRDWPASDSFPSTMPKAPDGV